MIIDIQGFKGHNNKFLVKELAILHNENEVQHFILKAPFDFNKLPLELQEQARWLHQNHHGLSWEGGSVTFHSVKQFLLHNLRNKIVYVKGCEKRNWLLDILGNRGKTTAVYDMDDLGCPNLRILKKQDQQHQQQRRCLNHKGYCALQNVYLLNNYLNKKNG